MWQPWETHPQDGKFFLACFSNGQMDVVNHRNGCFFGRWEKTRSRDPDYKWAFDYANLTPTHWMPLPKKPKKEVVK